MGIRFSAFGFDAFKTLTASLEPRAVVRGHFVFISAADTPITRLLSRVFLKNSCLGYFTQRPSAFPDIGSVTSQTQVGVLGGRQASAETF
jgi:hypothetical protein